MNKVEQRIQKMGRPLIGVAAYTYNPVFVEIAGYLGFHVLWIEMEHMPNCFSQVCDLCRIASGVGLLTMIRVADASRENVLKAAECSPDIIDVPMVNCPDTLRELVRHARYSPQGERGFFSASRASMYGLESSLVDQRSRINHDICLMGQVETRTAVDCVEELCEVQGMDAIFLGLGDLSASMGLTGDANHPVVIEAADRAINAAKSRGKLVAVPSAPETAESWVSKGADILFCGSDISFLRSGAEAAARELGSISSHFGFGAEVVKI